MCTYTGQTASDIANTPQMRQLLGVQPIKTLKLHPQRFEGPLSKVSGAVRLFCTKDNEEDENIDNIDADGDVKKV